MHERLKYRRQFIITNEIINGLNNWQYEIINPFHLYAHPDLEITIAKIGFIEIILLGSIFNPFHPEMNNNAIVGDMVKRTASFYDLVNQIKFLTGRYAIIYKDKKNLSIIHDPLSIREVYYCTQPNKVVCGSQPNLISKFSDPHLGLTNNKDIINFYNHDMKYVRSQRFWVGDETYYDNIKHLMPNHYLEIYSLTAKRYWPNKRLEKLDIELGVKMACEYLKGAIKAITLRHSVMMAITAGYDSRSLLAASKDVKDEIYYFINKESNLNDKSADIYIPKKIFEKLDLKFHVHNVGGPIDNEFREIFLENTFMSTDLILPTIYNVYYKNHQDKVNLLGVGEIGREYYGDTPKKLDGYYLARCLKFKKSKYATEQCEKWLNEVRKIAFKYNIDIMKLLLWEILLGGWGAVGNSESDIAIEEFDPYDSHYIYEIMMSVDQSKKDFFEEMFKQMWPELLDFPFNTPNDFIGWLKKNLGDNILYKRLKQFVYAIDRWRYNKKVHRGLT